MISQNHMAGESETVQLSWADIQELARKLAEEIREDRFTPECIMGVTVGGVFPMALLAKEFNTKDVAVISARSYENRQQGKLQVTALPKIDLEGKRILLVDEIADRGTTLRYLSKVVRKEYKPRELKTAVLVVNKKNCAHPPDFHVLSVDRWVVFPWESSNRKLGGTISG